MKDLLNSRIWRILDKQDKLNYNVCYDCPSEGYDRAREEERKKKELEDKYKDLENKFKNFFDIPKQNELGEKFPWSGYIDMNGKIYKCKSCEHESIIRQIILTEYMEEYLKVPASFYDHKPQGTFQEEYFAMKHLGFAKVSSFKNAPTKKILFFYDKLSWKQSNEIYPT